MTVSTTTSRIVYAGNGVTTIFAFPYRFLVNGDLELTLFAADGTSETLVLTTDYTVTGADSDAGGSVTMVVAPAVGETLVIRRVVDLTQETDYISGDAFPAESHERALDKLTMSDQQLQEQVDRSLTVPLDDVTFSGQLPPIVAERFLRINDSGTAIELVDALNAGELVVSPFIETLLDDANAAAARTTLGAQAAGSYALSGANDNITSLSGLTTPLSLAQGGSGANHASVAALFNAIKQAASDTYAGTQENSTDAETQAGTATDRTVTPASFAAASLGYGQTWQSVTRTAGVTYTNTTGRPIMLVMNINASGSASCSVNININGGGAITFLSASAGTGPTGAAGSFIIPPGATYVLGEVNVTSRNVYELR